MQGPRIAAKCWPRLTFNAPVDAQHFAGLLLAATTHQKKKKNLITISSELTITTQEEDFRILGEPMVLPF